MGKQTALRDLGFFVLLTGLQATLGNLLCFDLVFVLHIISPLVPDIRLHVGCLPMNSNSNVHACWETALKIRHFNSLLCFIDFSSNSYYPHPDSPGIPAITTPMKYFCLT